MKSKDILGPYWWIAVVSLVDFTPSETWAPIQTKLNGWNAYLKFDITSIDSAFQDLNKPFLEHLRTCKFRRLEVNFKLERFGIQKEKIYMTKKLNT